MKYSNTVLKLIKENNKEMEFHPAYFHNKRAVLKCFLKNKKSLFLFQNAFPTLAKL